MTSSLPYCRDCDSVPCRCDPEVNPRFIRDHVDPETSNGFNPVLWAQVVRQLGPIRLDPVSGAFWAYNSGVWREDRSVVQHRLPLKMGRNYRRGDCAHVQDRLVAEMKRDGWVIDPAAPSIEFVSLPSGLFEIATGKVVEHDPEVLTTYQLQVEPEFGADASEFDQFLESVLHPGDWFRVLDILAYLLLPGNPDQKAVMFSGRGRNGKGVLLQVVEAIIGKQCAASVSLQEMAGQFAASELYGKAINIVGDIDGGHITHTGKFKQMTGGDTVRMDVKHAQPFKAKVWAVPVFSANQIPTSADTSHGYLRRWEVVEFPNTFDGSDVTLVDRLLAELPAITGRLLGHAVAHPFGIRESEPGRRAHAVFANRSDPVRSWLVETELTGFMERKAAYLDYTFWIDAGNGRTALTKHRFYDRVAAVLGEPRKRKGVLGWEFVDPPGPDPFTF